MSDPLGQLLAEAQTARRALDPRESAVADQLQALLAEQWLEVGVTPTESTATACLVVLRFLCSRTCAAGGDFLAATNETAMVLGGMSGV
jgi:hypothetical protein